LYNSLEPNIPQATINWRVHKLVNKNIIARVGKGVFTWGATARFVPNISDKLREMHYVINKQFPFIKYCLWQAESIKEFNHHIPRVNFILADIEKDAAESVSYFLREKYREVFYKPTKNLLNNYIDDLDQAIIVRNLVSAAPIQTEEEIPTVTIEKLLADILGDREFEFLQGTEMVAVFRNALERYTINQSKLFRYADRKGKKEEIKLLINQLITS
jgi:hypothetical protein